MSSDSGRPTGGSSSAKPAGGSKSQHHKANTISEGRGAKVNVLVAHIQGRTSPQAELPEFSVLDDQLVVNGLESTR